MKHQATWAACLIVVTLASGGCSAPPTQRDAGMVIGGILGGLVGHELGGGSGRTVATIVGTIVGAHIGGEVGRSMDEQDRLRAALTLESVRTGVPTQWVNPDTGIRYVLTPTRTLEGPAGPCRDYTIQAVIDGRPEQVTGTACRQADGSWRVAP